MGAPRSARPVGGADAGGDEDRGAGLARRDIGGVPRPRRVDRVVAAGERHALGAAVGMFLVERAGALGADHEFRAMRVHLPRIPALGKGELRDQPALQPVRCVAGGIGLEPVGAGEIGLDGGAGGTAEMGGVGGEVGHVRSRDTNLYYPYFSQDRHSYRGIRPMLRNSGH